MSAALERAAAFRDARREALTELAELTRLGVWFSHDPDRGLTHTVPMNGQAPERAREFCERLDADAARKRRFRRLLRDLAASHDGFGHRTVIFGVRV